MSFFVSITFFTLVAFTNAGVLVGPSAKILQGPSSKTTIVGPEGSVITAVAPGGQIVYEEHPGVVAHSSPVVSYAAPVVDYHSAPLVAHAAPVVDHASPATVVAHSAAYEHSDVVVAGPSGTIATGHLAHAGHVVAHAAPVVAHAVPAVALIAHGDVDDNGHEGQYVHDYSEVLHDDGTYKHYHY